MKKAFIFIASLFVTANFAGQFSSCGMEKDDDPCSKEEYKTIEKTGILDPNHKSLSISVYDDGGGLVADAACHADMQVVYKWTDGHGTVSPPMKFEFVTVFGYFPQGPIEELSDGDETYWSCEVNEAEDKTKPGGTSYGINVTFDTDAWGDASFPPVEVTLRVSYSVYDPDAYAGAQ